MTTRQNFYAESLTESTTTSTTFTDKVSLTETLDNGADYFVFYSCAIVNSSNTTADAKLRLYDDTNAVALRSLNIENRAAALEYWNTFGFAKVSGTGSSRTISLEFAAESSGNTIKIKEATLLILKAKATDQYAESLGNSTTTSLTFTDKLSLTFTPPTTGDYLVLAAAEVNTDTAGIEPEVRLLAPDGSTVYSYVEHSNKDASNFMPYAALVKQTLANSSQTFKIQFATSDQIGEMTTIRNVAILAIRLDEQANSYYSESRGESVTTATSFQDKTTLTQTTTASEHIVFWSGQLGFANSSTTVVVSGRLTEDASSVQTSDHVGQAGKADITKPCMGVYKKTLTAASHTWKTQYKIASGAVNARIRESAIAVIDLTDASAGASSFAFQRAFPRPTLNF